jgi:membrane protease YdiL (CAAX protease family)
MESPQPRRARSTALRIASLLLMYFAFVAIFAVGWRVLHLPAQMHGGVLNPGLTLVSGALLLGSILAASALTLRFFDNRPLSAIGIPLSGPWALQILIGVLGGALTPLIFFAVASRWGAVHVSRIPVNLHLVLSATLPGLAAVFLLAFHEELLFRGYFMQLISGSGGRLLASLITGILFGLAHGGNPSADPAGLISTAVSGVLLAWLIFRSGSVWMAGGYHAAWNATGYFVLGLSVSGTSMPGSWIHTTISGLRWVTGGSYGFESSLIAGLAEPVILGCLVWLAPKLPSHLPR